MLEVPFASATVVRSPPRRALEPLLGNQLFYPGIYETSSGVTERVYSVVKYHRLLVNEDTSRLGFLCRVVNFLEDLLEDSECKDVRVDSDSLVKSVVLVEAVNCGGEVHESLEVFRERYDLKAGLGSGDLSLKKLYDHVIDHYARTLHKLMRSLAPRTLALGVEYYLGVLFDGKGFILEGEVERVSVPGIPQCFSAHTHPAGNPFPSPRDIKVINRLLLDRGVGHVIEAGEVGLAIYRSGPLTLGDYEALKLLEKASDTASALHALSKTVVKVRYIR